MSTIKCNVLVVGAGPAGSSAARASAKKGLKTIIIEYNVLKELVHIFFSIFHLKFQKIS
jgi:succinate dehydrogenase/fumarate reductase flavoprotein subunit